MDRRPRHRADFGDERDAAHPRRHLAALCASIIAHAALIAAIVVVARPITKPNGDLVLAYLVEVGDGSARGSGSKPALAAASAPTHVEAVSRNLRAKPSGRSRAITRAIPHEVGREVEPAGAEVASIAPVAVSSDAHAIRSPAEHEGANDGKPMESNDSGGASGPGGGAGTAGERVGDGNSLAHADYEKNPPPEYPTAARRRAEQGVVTIRVLVGADGSVERAELAESSGYDILDDAALRAVRTRWRFVPARRTGNAVESWVLVPIRFALTEASAAH